MAADARALPDGVRPGGRYGQWAPQPPALVVCDADGTLVGPSAAASDEVATAARRLGATGVRVGVATGRMARAAWPLVAQLAASGPHVLHNGAEVADGDQRTIAQWPLDEAQVDALLALAAEHDDAYAEIYTADDYCASALDERAAPHWELLGGPPAAVIASAAELGGAAVRKATLVRFGADETDELDAAIVALGLAAGPATSPRTPGMAYTNATHPEADKGRALAAACRHVGIDPAAAVAIGDAPNDLPMLRMAGTAIAMGQADATVQQAAHLVVPEVGAHGAAHALDLVAEWARSGRQPGSAV